MKTFDRLIFIFAVIGILSLIIINILMFHSDSNNDKTYMVEINRIENQLSVNENINIKDYNTIIGIYKYDESDDENLYKTENKYVIRKINNSLYRIEYNDNITNYDIKIPITINIIIFVTFVFVVVLLLYVRKNIIKPFSKLSNLPYNLAKGNLTTPIKENKSRYFGKYIWGINMLRETLETSKNRELKHIKKEKTLLLSLSHDIKTPLSAIKLYSKAISKSVYSIEKQREIAENINTKADEIEDFVDEIIRKSSSEFMSFEINKTDFYLSEVINKISDYYTEKLKLLNVAFKIEPYINCMISGDRDRLEEVLQNIIENAIKYGDGRYISISFSNEEDCRLITVSNSGCTLSDSELPHIFESFWRGSNVKTQQGNGLGLFICRQLMKGMNGDIFAEISDENMNVTLVCRKAE